MPARILGCSIQKSLPIRRLLSAKTSTTGLWTAPSRFWGYLKIETFPSNQKPPVNIKRAKKIYVQRKMLRTKPHFASFNLTFSDVPSCQPFRHLVPSLHTLKQTRIHTLMKPFIFSSIRFTLQIWFIWMNVRQYFNIFLSLQSTKAYLPIFEIGIISITEI